MPVYKYTALDAEGRKRTGTVEAHDKATALTLLRNEGLFLTGLEKPQEGILASVLSMRGISTNDVVTFTRQFSTMISAGLPLSRCLEVLIGQTDNPNFRKVLADILKGVEGGASLSDSFSKHPEVFSRTYQALVKAGDLPVTWI